LVGRDRFDREQFGMAPLANQMHAIGVTAHCARAQRPKAMRTAPVAGYSGARVAIGALQHGDRRGGGF